MVDPNYALTFPKNIWVVLFSSTYQNLTLMVRELPFTKSQSEPALSYTYIAQVLSNCKCVFCFIYKGHTMMIVYTYTSFLVGDIHHH
jgi:hypothetical protein